MVLVNFILSGIDSTQFYTSKQLILWQWDSISIVSNDIEISDKKDFIDYS